MASSSWRLEPLDHAAVLHHVEAVGQRRRQSGSSAPPSRWCSPSGAAWGSCAPRACTITGARPSEISSSSSSLAPVRRMRPRPASAARRPTGVCPGCFGASARGWGTWRRFPPPLMPWGRSSAPGAAAGSPHTTGWRRCRAPRSSSPGPGARSCAWADRTVSSPLIFTEPLRAPVSAHDGERVEVRPAPLRPSRVTTSPGWTTMSTPCNTRAIRRTRLRDCGFPARGCVVVGHGSVRSLQLAVGCAHVRFHDLRIL